MIDRTTKITLIAIAAGLWVNAIVIVLAPKLAHAQDGNSDDISAMASDISDIQTSTSSIEDDVNAMSNGTCTNDNICK